MPKNHIREAQIIAKAGEKGAVTVATNMAGRGVDIILGGEQPKDDGDKKTYDEALKKWKKSHDDVLSLGGLFVMGTERHESRRIDNQLRGRSGRQGDPGASRFFVALDDDIMRLFGGDKIAGIMTRFNMPEDVPLEHGLVSRAIENAQVKVEQYNFDIRKNLVEYDDVLNKQREIIYSLRQKILLSDANTSYLKDEMLKRIHRVTESIVMTSQAPEIANAVGGENEHIVKELSTIVPFDENAQKQLLKQLEQYQGIEAKMEFVQTLTSDMYQKLEGHIGVPLMREVERSIMLRTIDNFWMDHLEAIHNLEGGIRLRGYAQKDPLVEYKNEGFKMFEKLLFTIDDEIVHQIYKVQVQTEPLVEAPTTMLTNTPDSEVSDTGKKPAISPKKMHTHTHTHADGKLHTYSHEVDDTAEVQPAVAASTSPSKKIGRNDPCWCGSGKKYKKCHYPN